jgi:phosphate transport system substrate-binding protein
MKKIITLVLTGIIVIASAVVFASCANTEKNITVVVREQGSGTREAFDKVVTDGEHYLEEKGADGKKVYNTTQTAIQQTKTGTVLSSVASDKNAIGYISLGSVDSSVSVVKVNGVTPTEATVLSGDYKIQRPFVIMTKAGQTLTDRTADFMDYLKSAASKEHSEAAGCIFLEDASKRANAAATPIEVVEYEKQSTLPAGDKIVIRGSTSMEKFINSAAKGYADLYGAKAEEIFDIQLEGSSVGRKTAEDDTKGNVIGLSSSSVSQDNIDSFNVCLDAVAVVVNKENTQISDLTLAELYDIFSGKVTKFSELQK